MSAPRLHAVPTPFEAHHVRTPRLDPAPTSAPRRPTLVRAAPERRAWVEQVMGMPVSVHARGAGARGGDVDGAVRTFYAELCAIERLFSTYRPTSQVSRLQRGELALAECHPVVTEVHRLCTIAHERTGGWFDAWGSVPGRPGVFDPTGLVKTWAVGRAARHLADLPGLDVAVNAGGDVLLRQHPESDEDAEPWLVGIEDPRDRRRVLATVPVHDGGVATSGTAARGAHILDPRTGRPATEVLSATVIGPSLLWADVWATAAVARGGSAVDWVASLHGTSGMLVLADGRVHRWTNAV